MNGRMACSFHRTGVLLPTHDSDADIEIFDVGLPFLKGGTMVSIESAAVM